MIVSLHMENNGKIVIEYASVPNERKHLETQEPMGYLPMVWVDGREICLARYADRGYSEDEAGSMAYQRAHEEAERYIGDWDKKIRPRSV